MVKTNGLNSADPDYNDYGYSDFVSDYQPTDEQLIDFISENPEELLILLRKNKRRNAISDIEFWWVDKNQDEIESEWDSRGEEE